MPELPEVEITVRSIAPIISGQTVVDFRSHHRKLRRPIPANLATQLIGQTVRHVFRRAKYIIIDFDHGSLIVHLGMSGSLRLIAGATSDIPPRKKHDHLEWFFSNGILLRYHDPRRFGLCVWTTSPPLTHALFARLGPEPFDERLTAEQLQISFSRRSIAIKNALMDAAIIVGVGNIYANEALFRAGIHPETPACQLRRARVSRLLAAIRATLNDALAAGGSSLRDYVHTDGEEGWFQLQTFVYGRSGESCRKCGTLIRTIRQSGRATYYCARCQK
ncbi:MAG: bifunctional DNA-formamidopyrimidine glycosylase/DNA-(apurinic or apyrimidinic site) lyase [Burkholderiales bacterium]|nr:bifunctional DNA-formamidopyrimidine glycosylase/DNA-(apurinic or apyrimidinic site) lyase [Burkholderiales bacterium]